MPETEGAGGRGDADAFESFLQKTLRILGFVFALPLIPVGLAAISSPITRWLSFAALVAAAIAFFRPQPLPLMRTRLGAIGLAYLALVGVIAGYAAKSDAALRAGQEAKPAGEAGQSAPPDGGE